jgi:glycine cleavage system H lipoate-binding protein
MSILFALVTFLLFVLVSYLRSTQRTPVLLAHNPQVDRTPKVQLMNLGVAEVPKDYSFHFGHTWAAVENSQHARVGMDDFAANLMGTVESVDLPGLNRWVRQGQPVCKLTVGDTTLGLVAPVEGIITAVNTRLRDEPSLATSDPYGNGWLYKVQSPDLAINLKNLMKGGLVKAWFRDSIERVNAMAAGFAPALAQDGGLPVRGLLTRVDEKLRRQMIQEFFLFFLG